MEKTALYYEEHAQRYYETTKHINMSAQHKMLTHYLTPRAYILDLGCGSGRDSLAFLQAGYKVRAVDGSKPLCQLASTHIKQPVYHQQFSELKDVNEYDAIYACASLLHLPSNELAYIFKLCEQALKCDGYMYASFKHGTFEGYREERYFTDFTAETFELFIQKIPTLTLLECVISEDSMNREASVKWLNVILKKETKQDKR